MPLLPGAHLGPYTIVAPIGSGGMGEVYRARDKRLGREVAIKVLPDQVAASPDRLARLEREARAVAALNHPNIVVLHSIEENGGTRFLTMELVEGRSLTTLVTPGGLPLSQLLELTIPLAEALVAAHDKGVVHRDLKPANVMLSRDGRVKVLDFGLAKLTQSDPDPQHSQAATVVWPISDVGQVVGTAPYMAPEQVRGEAVDARTDLFAFGILTYELATGQRPFKGRAFADVTSSILRDDPPSLANLRPDLPRDLARILGRCLMKEPRDRYQTALDVANELRALRRGLERGGWFEPVPPPVALASIAVLPFVNRSAAAEDEYFSDGLADELLNVLGRIRGLRVAARTSAFRFKGKDATIAEVGHALNVATVLEGSVRKAGNRVRIAVQLVKVSDGYHLWSEIYDRTLDDIFAVQDEIARSVVKQLRTTLLGEEEDSKASGEARTDVANAVKGRGIDPEAHRLYLQARHQLTRMAPDETARAIHYLEEALQIDPSHALAWTMLGHAHQQQAGNGWSLPEEGYTRARAAVERALALEPDQAEAFALLGKIQWNFDWNWRAAEASHRRALELEPRNPWVLRAAGLVAYCQCRFNEAADIFRRAIEIDPLSNIAYHNLGLVHHCTGNYLAGETAYRRSLDLAPGTAVTTSMLAFLLLEAGRGEEALAEIGQETDETNRLHAIATITHALGREAESEAALGKLIRDYGRTMAAQIAEIYAQRGELDPAFEWLEKAYEDRDAGLSEMRASPRLRPLHGDPRWAAFMRKMGFES